LLGIYILFPDVILRLGRGIQNLKRLVFQKKAQPSVQKRAFSESLSIPPFLERGGRFGRPRDFLLRAHTLRLFLFSVVYFCLTYVHFRERIYVEGMSGK